MTRLAYVLGASHSGSTLLSMLLGSHPQIATVGELTLSSNAMGDLDRYRCSCGAPIRECGFWHKVTEDMRRRGVAFDLTHAGTDYREVESRYARRLLRPMYRGRALEALRDGALWLSPTWRKRLSDMQKRNSALVSTVSEIAGADVVVDSSKIALRLKYLLRNSDLEVKVIRLIRDGRAVALTYMDPAGYADADDPGKRAGGMGGDRRNERLSMAQAAYEWRRCIEEAEYILGSMKPSRWIEIRYEDYCREPERTLRRVHEFLGVESGAQPREFRSVEQHVVGNGMRLNTTSKIQLDDRWRQTLTARDLQTFDEIAGPTNRRYGYQ
ncbi:MAG: sulfotransferase [Phycisphaerales bacterium]|nr:MAG: sulfotransferase [Phycisphaerales bacterium]